MHDPRNLLVIANTSNKRGQFGHFDLEAHKPERSRLMTGHKLKEKRSLFTRHEAYIGYLGPVLLDQPRSIMRRRSSMQNDKVYNSAIATAPISSPKYTASKTRDTGIESRPCNASLSSSTHRNRTTYDLTALEHRQHRAQ